MKAFRICAFLILVGIAAGTIAQQAPGHGSGSESDTDRQSPGLSDSSVSVEALLAENARLNREVNLLKKKIELLQLRIRTLEGSQ